MDITAETLQSFLDDAWDAAPVGANTLRDTLRSFEKSITVMFSAGSLSSVSKNSASQSYRGPGVGSYTPVQIANAWRMLINLHDKIKWRVSSGDIQPITPPAGIDVAAGDNDYTIYSFMQCSIRPVTEYESDITELLLPPTLSPPTPFAI